MADKKTRIITLSRRVPVEIVEDDWPVVAMGAYDWWEGEFEWQANRSLKMRLVVRRHTDGRTIVYGVHQYDTSLTSEESSLFREGETLFECDKLKEDEVNSEEVIDSIVSEVTSMGDTLAERTGDDRWREVARDCIADFPPQRL